MRAVLVTLVGLVALGCSAQIPDGRIGCHDPGGTCPPGYSCWSDQLCRRMPEPDDGALRDSDLPPNDSGLPPVDANLPRIDAGAAACTMDSSCTPPDHCLAGRWPGGAVAMCADATAARPAMHGTACTMDAQCQVPDGCLGGACVRPCLMAAGNPPCGAGEDCVPAPPTTPSISGQVCIVGGCTSAAACPNTSFECVMPPGGGRANCFPIAWHAAGTRL